MLRRFWPYFGRYKKYLILSGLCVMAECLFELVIPLIMADILDVGVPARDTGYILMKGGQMVACALVSLALGAVYARLAALGGPGVRAPSSARRNTSRCRAFPSPMSIASAPPPW